jgi:hypothetical protein
LHRIDGSESAPGISFVGEMMITPIHWRGSAFAVTPTRIEDSNGRISLGVFDQAAVAKLSPAMHPPRWATGVHSANRPATLRLYRFRQIAG